MKSRACSIIAILMAVGCGSGTKPSTPGYGGASGQQCLPNADCLSCIRQNCDSEAMTAFGGGYMNDQFNGGQCPNLMACSCTTNGTDNGNGSMDICAQQGGSGCVAAWNALNTCVENAPCFSTTCKTEGGNGGNGGNGSGGNGGSNGLTVNGNSMNFGNTEAGTAQILCLVVTGSNAPTIIPQVLNDTSCAAGGCAFSAQPLYCETSDLCDVCVIFAPNKVGAATATLNIAPGLTVALSGTGTASTTGAGGATSTGGSSTSTLPGTGGTTVVGGTGGTTVVSTVDASAGTGGSAGIDADIDIGGAGGIVGTGGSIGIIDAGGIDGTSAAGGTTSVESTGLDGTWTWVSGTCNGTAISFSSDTTSVTLQISGSTGEFTMIRSACPTSGGGGTESGNLTLSYPSAGSVTMSWLSTTCVPANCSGDCTGPEPSLLTSTYTIQGNQLTWTTQQTPDNYPPCRSGLQVVTLQKQGSVGTGGGGGNATGGTSTTGAGGATGGTISTGGTSAAGGTTSVESTGLDGTWTWVSLACSGTDVPFAPDTTLTTFQISGSTGELTIIRSACPTSGGGGTESGNMTFSYPSAGHVTISSPLPITCVPANCSADDCDGSRTFGLTGTYTYTIQGNQATLTDQQTGLAPDICPAGYLNMVWQKQGSGGTGGSTGSVGTGGSIGSGGITGAGGSTSSTSAPACPLGTWTTTGLGIVCGTINASGVWAVTETVAGQYSVTLTAGPLNHQGSCQMMTWGSLSATYMSGALTFALNPDSDTCAQKLATTTMTIDADCTQGTMKTTTVGCLNCDNDNTGNANGGNGCSGCGSMTCPPTGPDTIGVRSP